ncbi:hypothetical protein, partial [Xanthomonas sp. SHU 166]|uniref:hypothetical protein n=1 Tax=Xanthomonas sp. SHU 166 TaxID=1591170 RepID=UPI001E5A5687
MGAWLPVGAVGCGAAGVALGMGDAAAGVFGPVGGAGGAGGAAGVPGTVLAAGAAGAVIGAA